MTSPLITPDVVVKTRFGVTQTVVSGNEKKPGSQKTTIKSDHVIGATTVQMISDWMNKGRPAGEYPFPEDQQKLARGLRFAGLDDLRDTEFNPDDGDMNVDLPAPKLPTTSDAET